MTALHLSSSILLPIYLTLIFLFALLSKIPSISIDLNNGIQFNHLLELILCQMFVLVSASPWRIFAVTRRTSGSARKIDWPGGGGGTSTKGRETRERSPETREMVSVKGNKGEEEGEGKVW